MLSPLFPQQPAAPGSEVTANAKKARGVLERALQALGGRAYLELRDLHQQGRTNRFYRGSPSGVGAPFHRFWKAPDKERIEHFKKREWIIIHNGDQGFDTTYRGTRKEDPADLAEYIRRRDHSLDTLMRHWLSKPDLILGYEGLALSDRKQVEKVSLTRPGFNTVTVFVDTVTHLPLRTLYTFRDPETRDMVEEGETFDNYKDVQGINTPHNIVRVRDGEMVRQYFVRTVEYNTGVPDSKFQATVNLDPKLR
ncbi:MAG: hypothetical protein ACRD2Y_06980 [Terriglobales bacterium]